MNEKSLFDTGFLLAVLNVEDEFYESCVVIYEKENRAILPEVVIPELAYMVMRDLGYEALVKFLRSVVDGDFILARTELQDLKRAAEVLEKYADSRADFVDCVIVAIAERFNIKRILTVDRRHFNMFRPKHCDAFEIVP